MTVIICLRWIAYVLLIASAIPAGLSISRFIKSRRAKYYGIRRQSLQQALRWLLIMGVTQVAAITLLIVCPLLQSASSPPSADTTMTPTVTSIAATPSPTATPRPSRPPTTESTKTPPPPTATPQPEARITFKALSTEVNGGRPVDPGDSFPPGDHRVYVFFRYQGMTQGLRATVNWYKDGEVIDFCSDTWSWGQDEDYAFDGAVGASLIYCRAPGGWQPGNHEVHFLVEGQLQFIVEFQITEE